MVWEFVGGGRRDGEWGVDEVGGVDELGCVAIGCLGCEWRGMGVSEGLGWVVSGELGGWVVSWVVCG